VLGCLAASGVVGSGDSLVCSVPGPPAMNPVCLVIPPSPFLLDERVFMSLGILRVAAVLERAGVPVEVVDLSGIQNYQEAMRYHAEHSPSEIFAFTATTPQMPSAFELSRVVDVCRPESRLVLGGPHPTLTLAAVKKEKVAGRATRALNDLYAGFDVVVAGDGEQAIFQAIAPDAPRLIDADDPKGDLFLTNMQLNELPFPARHLVDVRSYHYGIEGEPAISLIAQLGCPFSCGFCGGRNSAMLRRVRTRTTDNVVKEMVHLYQTYGTKGFMLYDDELNVNPQMVELMNAIGDAQEALGVQFKLRGFIKSQLFTDAQAAAMYRAGFRWILTGFESGSPRILQNINKRATREENTRCVDIARRNNLKVKALMSIGHPGESPETLQETEQWLLENKPEDFDVTIITPYPGSPYYDDAVFDGHSWVYTVTRTGDKLYAQEVDYLKTADYYKGDPNGGYRSYVWTDTLPAELLVSERDGMEKRVRQALGIAYNPGAPGVKFEHSMGQGLPSTILRKSVDLAQQVA
jgi:anaerobic magnesium-protoporphyrin IX monomethyl ester cyclase